MKASIVASKFYVVWQGRETGIFTDWATCKKQVEKFPGAKYKSFESRAEAESAFGAAHPGGMRAPGSLAAVVATLDAHTAATARGAGAAGGTGGVRKPAAAGAAGAMRAAGGVKRGPKTWTARELAELPHHCKIFCDGGCDPNPGKAGSGLALYRDGVLAELWYGLFNPHGTNNTAELNALHQALLLAQQEVAAERTVAIFCDSQYSIQCVTEWAIGWQKKGWKKAGGEIKNLELIKQLFALHQALKDKIEVLHVNGHVGVEGNELADRMSILAIARRAASFVRYDGALNIPTILALRAG
jgi:ribonuclease HI